MPLLYNNELKDWLNISILFNNLNLINANSNLKFYPVSTAVNSIQNNSTRCITESYVNIQDSLF